MNLSDEHNEDDFDDGLEAYDTLLCERCCGTGVDDEAEDKVCPACDGTGYINDDE